PTPPTPNPQTAADYRQLEDRFGARNYHPLDVVLARGQDVWVWDVEGNRYLDCLAAYSAVNQGHSHPAIVAALAEQAAKLAITGRAFRNDQLPLLYQTLHDLTGYTQFLLMNSGAEAVETAVKAARKWGYQMKGIPADRARIVTAAGNFHGRTTTVVSFSTEHQYRDGFGPLTPGFDTVPFGDLVALEAAFTPDTAAFLVEPIQAEGGILMPPEGYLRQAAELCHKHNVLFMVDEIQTGWGRTGKLFAWEYDGARPDVVLVGKALSGGLYPVSAVLSTPEVLGVFQPGDHGSTFGGNPLACAVARAALQVLTDEHLVQKSLENGEYFRTQLRALNSPRVAEVRGRGLLVGVELTVNARPVAEALMRRGVLVKDTHGTVLRLTPPLTIARAELDLVVRELGAVLGGM
ncbi:MAG: ornithine--oxo-acid transaminase, partial [Spirochaetales bacterium]